MEFRIMKDDDEEELSRMLSEEKIPVLLQQYANPAVETVVMLNKGKPVGFFSWNIQHGSAALMHFVVDRSSRSYAAACALARKFTSLVKSEGIKQVLVGVPETNPSVYTFIKYWFKNAKIYSIKPQMLFMKAEVK